ncbi:putative polyketide hydroxylase [Streptomyces sp. DconLS]|nr:putative polyketide hydroxylase [Streptomyces sp. DconLS]
MHHTADHRVPVLIVGGSLVGLSTSLFLGRLGVRHTLVERHSGTSHHPRGRGNNVRTMELFRVAGIEPDIKAAASLLADNHGILQTPTLVGEAGEWLFKEIDPGGGLRKFSPTAWNLCSQNDLEPVLLDGARELGGDLRYHHEMESFEQDADGVTAIVRDRSTDERYTVRADYLVAADGPRSPVRRALGIGQSGPGELFANVSVTFRSTRLADVVGDRRFICCYLTHPDADGALLPVDNKERWVFHAPWHPELGESLDEFTEERLQRHIARAVGVPDLDVRITGMASWRAAERVADSYAQGRVFLAGDSAHEMSPTGAFGSNTGIQDAHNLAWKLAAVLDGWAGPALLDSYGAERRPVAVATSARASARSVEHSHPGFAPAPASAAPSAAASSMSSSATTTPRAPPSAPTPRRRSSPTCSPSPAAPAPAPRTCGCARPPAGCPPSTSTSAPWCCSPTPRTTRAGTTPPGASPPWTGYGWTPTGSAPAATPTWCTTPRATTGPSCTASVPTARSWSAPTASSPGAPRAPPPTPRPRSGTP